MGDSCFNSGMKSITKMVGETLDSYSVCVPTGNRLTDTTNGFFMTMNDNVDLFAANIAKDEKRRGSVRERTGFVASTLPEDEWLKTSWNLTRS